MWTLPGTDAGPSASGSWTYDAATLHLPPPTAGLGLGTTLQR